MNMENLSEKVAKDIKVARSGLEQAQREQGKIEAGDVLEKIFATVGGRARKAREGLLSAEKKLEDVLKEAESHLDEIRAEADAYVGSYTGAYHGEWGRMSKETAPSESEQAKRGKSYDWLQEPTSSVSDFIDDVDDIKLPEGASLDDKAKVLALLDLLQPKMHFEGWAGGEIVIGNAPIAIRNGSRFPRLDLGTDLKSAEEKAKENGWSQVLKLKAEYSGRFGGKNETYIAVSPETAKLIELGGSDNLDSKSSVHTATGTNWGQFVGGISQEYELLSINEKESVQ